MSFALINTPTTTPTPTNVNLPPVAAEDHYTTDQDTPLIVNAPGVLSNDSDDNPNTILRADLALTTARGALTFNNAGSFTYMPSPGFNGSDIFSYVVTDGIAFSLPGDVYITVNKVNHPPVANPDAFTTTVGAALAGNLLTNDHDPDSDPLQAIKLSEPANGNLTLQAKNDRNHNYARNAIDEWVSGWTMQPFSTASGQVGSQSTDSTGRATFLDLRPDGYTVWEVMQPGWFNITPSVLTRPYQKPCYPVTLAAGQAVAVRFGNSTTPLVAAAEEGAFGDVIVMDLPDTDDEGNEVSPLPDPWPDPWPDAAEEQVNALFLPLVTR